MKIDPKIRQKLNAGLAELCKKRHPHIPNKDIADLLSPFGLKMEEAIFCGRSGNGNMELYNGDTNITNAWLVLQWYKGDVSNDYEINAYIS